MKKTQVSILQSFRAHSFEIQADYNKKYHAERDELKDNLEPINRPEH